MKTRTEDLVSRYLKRLGHELQGLTQQQRQEILDEVTAHIEESLAGTDRASEADVRNVLDRLGDPADIAREAYARFGTKRAKTGFVEVAALVLLPIGGIILPILGWIVGVILLWVSSAWTAKEKLVGTLVIPGGLGAAFFLTLLPGRPTSCHTLRDGAGRVIEDTCSQIANGPNPLAILGLVLLIVAPLLSVTYLIVKLRQRSHVPLAA